MDVYYRLKYLTTELSSHVSEGEHDCDSMAVLHPHSRKHAVHNKGAHTREAIIGRIGGSNRESPSKLPCWNDLCIL